MICCCCWQRPRVLLTVHLENGHHLKKQDITGAGEASHTHTHTPHEHTHSVVVSEVASPSHSLRRNVTSVYCRSLTRINVSHVHDEKFTHYTVIQKYRSNFPIVHIPTIVRLTIAHLSHTESGKENGVCNIISLSQGLTPTVINLVPGADPYCN